MTSKMTALTISGENSRVVAKEVYQAFYELTKDPGNGKQISDLDRSKYLKTKYDQFTKSEIINMFAYEIEFH